MSSHFSGDPRSCLPAVFATFRVPQLLRHWALAKDALGKAKLAKNAPERLHSTTAAIATKSFKSSLQRQILQKTPSSTTLDVPTLLA